MTVQRTVLPTFRFETGAFPAIQCIKNRGTIEATVPDSDGLGTNLKVLAHKQFDLKDGRTFPGNPLIGPYAIEGATKGDALVVDILTVQPNREIARTLIQQDHGYWKTSPLWNSHGACRCRIIKWKVEGKFATPLNSFGKHFPRVPCKPFLGCIATATSDKGTSTLLATNHGGNLDLPLLGPGTTVALPVQCNGGLLYFGDMHAAQGAGEIVGGGLEISGDVKLRCRVRTSEGPLGLRFKNGSGAGSIAVAKTMEAAVKHPFGNLVAWLMRCDMTQEDAIMFLSQTCTYHIGGLSKRYCVVACSLAKANWPTSDFKNLL